MGAGGVNVPRGSFFFTGGRYLVHEKVSSLIRTWILIRLIIHTLIVFVNLVH